MKNKKLTKADKYFKLDDAIGPLYATAAVLKEMAKEEGNLAINKAHNDLLELISNLTKLQSAHFGDRKHK